MGARRPQNHFDLGALRGAGRALLVALAALGAISCGDDDGADGSENPLGVAGAPPNPGAPTAVAGAEGGNIGTAGIAGAATGSSGVSAGTVGVAGSAAGAGAPAGSGGTGVAGASGGAGAIAVGPRAEPAFAATGMPIMAPEREWTWLPFASSKCRDGSMAGIGINMSSASKNVMVYLEGVGACFNANTCGASADSVSAQSPGSAGVFNRTRLENPVKDWSHIFIPYCTGDVHMGANDDGRLEGVSGTQHFVGRLNLEAFLHRIVPTFSDAKHVLLTGVSAGGFGASANSKFVQWAFGEIPVTMIDDSGPAMSHSYTPKCLSDIYKREWALSGSILQDCGSDCRADGDYATQFLEHVFANATGRYSGLISADEDAIIRSFFGVGTNNGANDCKGTLLLTPMDPSLFREGLLDYRKRVQRYPGASTFFPTSTQHTWLGSASFYTATAGGVTLVDWFRGVLEGKPARHVGLE